MQSIQTVVRIQSIVRGECLVRPVCSPLCRALTEMIEWSGQVYKRSQEPGYPEKELERQNGAGGVYLERASRNEE